MIVVRPKISELTLRLFGRAIHPELIEVFATRQLRRPAYSARIDITGAGHVITWSSPTTTLTEVTASAHQPMPHQRQLLDCPLVGSGHQQLVCDQRVGYQCRFRLETSNAATLADMQHQLAEPLEGEGLMFQFQASGRMSFGAVSYLHIQSRQRWLRVRALHTFPDSCSLLTTESTFQLIDGQPTSDASL
jgi:hypothetical protein